MLLGNATLIGILKQTEKKIDSVTEPQFLHIYSLKV